MAVQCAHSLFVTVESGLLYVLGVLSQNEGKTKDIWSNSQYH